MCGVLVLAHGIILLLIVRKSDFSQEHNYGSELQEIVQADD